MNMELPIALPIVLIIVLAVIPIAILLVGNRAAKFVSKSNSDKPNNYQLKSIIFLIIALLFFVVTAVEAYDLFKRDDITWRYYLSLALHLYLSISFLITARVYRAKALNSYK